jgi:hypothetical protein
MIMSVLSIIGALGMIVSWGIDTQQMNKMERVHHVGFLTRFAMSLARSGRGATYNA